MNDLKDVKLGEIINFKNGKKKPSEDGTVPIYGGNGILGYTNISNYGECIIIGRVGAYCGSVYYEEKRCWISDNAIVAIPMEGLDVYYAYYLLKSLHLNHRHIGTSQPLLTQEILNKIDCQIPEHHIQKKISGFLRNIDDKIACNEEINKNLAEQSQTIYQQYFITEAGQDWPLGHLSDLVNVKYGKDHKKLADGIYPVYGSGGIMRYVERPLYEKESVLIPRKGTLNNVMYVNQPFWSVDTMFYTEMKQPNVAKFVYHFMKSKDLASMNAGSAVPSMTTAILNALEISIPSAETLKHFEISVAPMYEMMQKNEEQSHKLTKLRDVLLPKLMSGEIDVSTLDL